MNTKEINYAYKVRHALNEHLEHLPTATVDRLSSARQMALSRKKNASPLHAPVFLGALAGSGASGKLLNTPFAWRRRMMVILPLLLAAAGLVSIFQFEQQQRIRETAELDALVLADELPLNAYLDHGFNAYLAKSKHGA